VVKDVYVVEDFVCGGGLYVMYALPTHTPNIHFFTSKTEDCSLDVKTVTKTPLYIIFFNDNAFYGLMRD